MTLKFPIRRPGPGTPVTVLGLALSGAAAAGYLLRLGCVVRISEGARTPDLERAAREMESAGGLVELGKHTRGFIHGSHLVVLSPGVPMDAPPVRWARAAGVPMVSEMELGSWYCSGRTVAVTGSNGKSTVVTLLGRIFEAAGLPVVVCGNIGTPLCSVLHRIEPGTIVVLEVSSFQLEPSLSFHTEVACVLNLTDNHFDRHGSLRAYRSAKAKLLASQGPRSWTVLNADDEGSFGLRDQVRGQLALFSRRQNGRHKVPGTFLQKGGLRLDVPSLSGLICRAEELPSEGVHHEENALAAACMAGLMGVGPDVSGRALTSFRGLPHRQEWVGELRGVTFINDSKSTTVASGIRAIQAAPGRVVLIAGGRDKGGNFRQLQPWARKLKGAVLIGEDGSRIAGCLKRRVPVREAPSLEEAVRAAFEMAGRGGCVLLSPMCTSFDMFRDFEERGERFVEAVKAMGSA